MSAQPLRWQDGCGLFASLPVFRRNRVLSLEVIGFAILHAVRSSSLPTCLTKGGKLQNTNPGYSLKMKITQACCLLTLFQACLFVLPARQLLGTARRTGRLKHPLCSTRRLSHEENAQDFLIQPLQCSSCQEYFPTPLRLTPSKERPKPALGKIHR